MAALALGHSTGGVVAEPPDADPADGAVRIIVASPGHLGYTDRIGHSRLSWGSPFDSSRSPAAKDR